MNQISLTMAIFRPALKKKFEFKTIERVTFTANKIHDKLDLAGYGTTDGKYFEERKMKTLKLSENGEYSKMFLKSISHDLKESQIDVVILTINFLEKNISSEIYFRHIETNKKDSKTFLSKF